MVENFTQGEKMEVLEKELPVEYSLIDKFYKSDTSYTRGKEVIGGRKTKEFFDNFCQIIFRKNLEMYERSGFFPLAYTEKNTYSSISATLDEMECSHISEWGLDCNRREDEEKSNRYRFVDFWCEKDGYEFWIEAKAISMNIGKNAYWEFTTRDDSLIREAITQVRDVKSLQDGEGVKIAWLTISTWYRENQQPDESDLETVPKEIAKQLSTYLDKRSDMGLLCGVLDFRKCIEKYDLFDSDEKVPYMIVAGIVLH